MKEILSDIRARLESGQYRNEEHVRLSLVARILQQLGWNIWNPSEVNTEFCPVPEEDKTKVDIALFLEQNVPAVFVEVKSVGKLEINLSQTEHQLRDYNKNNSALFCVITDGRTWRFYYPLTAGEFSKKCFKVIDLLKDDIDEVELTLHAFLSTSEIINGNAENDAKEYLQLSKWEQAIADVLPQAKRIILEPPFPNLVDAVLQILHTQGNTKITSEKISDFIQKPNPLDRPLERISDFSETNIEGSDELAGNKISIVLKKTYTANRWGLIPIGKKNRSLFPGYNVPFTLDTDIGELVTHVTSAPAGTRIGDPIAGSYIQGNLKPWYNKHVELKDGDKLIIEILEPKRKYRLTIKK